MLLAIDIGNTTIALAIIKNQKILHVWRLEAAQQVSGLKGRLQKTLLSIQKKYPVIDDIVICSVVPKTLKIVKRTIQNTLKKRPLVIGRDISVPIKNCYRSPKQVGQDRLVCAYAAKILYGTPCIVIDLGTATTFDVISKKGHYVGGLIVPGLKLSVESLRAKTALLPNVRIEKPQSLIGKDTKNSILSGIFYGYGSLCDGLVGRISKKIKGKPLVVATGGHISLMKKFSSKISLIDENLVFKGMYLIYQQVPLEHCVSVQRRA